MPRGSFDPLRQYIARKYLRGARSTVTDLRVRSLSTNIHVLDNWDLDKFQNCAFTPRRPVLLPKSRDNLFPACTKWFVHDQQPNLNLSTDTPQSSGLRLDYWKSFAQEIVPLEITRYDSVGTNVISFEKIEAPLDLLLRYLNEPSCSPPSYTIYLAQHDLRNLPQALQDDLPLPELVQNAGKGDLYSSSLWLGRSPTYTPLHRDPNPNLFVQLAGTKTIRLFHPEIGDAILEHARNMAQGVSAVSDTAQTIRSRPAVLRGEEMMYGNERTILNELVWSPQNGNDRSTIQDHVMEAKVGIGQALFIPQGWWHSVKGIGSGVVASANWWFR